jgi:hypothetical protein
LDPALKDLVSRPRADGKWIPTTVVKANKLRHEILEREGTSANTFSRLNDSNMPIQGGGADLNKHTLFGAVMEMWKGSTDLAKV